MKKIIPIITVFLLIIIFLQTTSSAIINLGRVNVYSKGYFTDLLKWNGAIVETNFAVYQSNGIEYPAYCLQRDLPGVTATYGYETKVEKLLNDVKIWRTIINGYPYKTYQELGCANESEAFVATKQAVYCAIYDRDPNTYSGIGEAGARTLNALKVIVNNSRQSTETKLSSNLTIQSENNRWELTENSNKYVSRVFFVSSEGPMTSYKVELPDIKVEGYKIVDMNGNEKNEFNAKEKFKILLPLKNIPTNEEFTISATAKVTTKPVLYAEAIQSSNQDYALTGAMYEEGTGSKKFLYVKNYTGVYIIKQEQDTKKPLQGVEFKIYDEQKNEVYSDLITNETGLVTVDNMLPGKYFIKEVKTLDGYYLYQKEIEVNLDLGEQIKVIVNNSKEEVEFIEPEESEIEVEEKSSIVEVKEKEQIQIEKVENKTSETEVNTSEQVKTVIEKIPETETQVQAEVKTQIVEIPIQQTEAEVVVKLPKTGM